MNPSNHKPLLLKFISVGIVGVTLSVLFYVQIKSLVLFAKTSTIALHDPYGLNYGEGPLLDQTVRLAHGENIYQKDLSQPPFTITNYPPVYLLLQLPFVLHFGPAFWYGRLISLVSAVLAALFLALIIYTITTDWISAVAGGGTLLAMPYVYFWSMMARVDCLALAFSLIGIWIAVRWYDRRWGVIFSALFLTIAVYTRQTYLLTAPLATFVYLWTHSGRFRAFQFGIFFGSFVVSLLIVLLIATHGAFLFHVIVANFNAINSHQIIHYSKDIAKHFPIILTMGVIYLVAGGIRRHPAWPLIITYSLAATLCAMTICKVGSDVNYLLELSVAFCLVSSGMIALTRRWLLLRAGVLLILALAVNAAIKQSIDVYSPILRRNTWRTEQLNQLVEIVRVTNQPILTDEYMGLLAVNGKAIQIQPFEMTQLAKNGQWDQNPFLNLLEKGAYPVILLYNPKLHPQLLLERWTPEMLTTIDKHYYIDSHAAETLIYRYGKH